MLGVSQYKRWSRGRWGDQLATQSLQHSHRQVQYWLIDLLSHWLIDWMDCRDEYRCKGRIVFLVLVNFINICKNVLHKHTNSDSSVIWIDHTGTEEPPSIKGAAFPQQKNYLESSKVFVWSKLSHCWLICSVRVAWSKGVNGVLPSEACRADSRGEVLGEGAAPPQQQEGLGSGSGAEPQSLSDFPVLWGLQTVHSATLLRENSCRSPSIWQQWGLHQPPWGPEITWAGGLSSVVGGLTPLTAPVNSHPAHTKLISWVKGESTQREFCENFILLTEKYHFNKIYSHHVMWEVVCGSKSFQWK